MKKSLTTFIITLILLPAINCSLWAQGNISFTCSKLNLSQSATLKLDPASEDDPGDLAVAIARFSSYFPKDYNGTDQMFEFLVPTRIGTYHLSAQNQEGKNDSLWAKLVYNADKKSYGKEITAYPKYFTITVTRYDAIKGGVIEGTFKGSLQSYIAWKHETDTFTVKGSFRTTRGKSGWECRKQRPSEKAVISKAINIFDNYFAAPLESMGWQIKDKVTGVSSEISNDPSPSRPLMLCSQFYQLKLTVNPNSAYSKMLQDSAEYYAKQSSLQATKNMFRISRMQNIEIKIEENDPYLYVPHGPTSKEGKFTLLHIPGAAYACQTYTPSTGNYDQPDEATSLYFGTWKGANQNSKYVAFPFTHKHHSANIENFVITINAPASVANEIIRKINWAKLNEALSK